MVVHPVISAIAAEVLTDGQREVWELVIQGESQRAVSYSLDVARSSTGSMRRPGGYAPMVFGSPRTASRIWTRRHKRRRAPRRRPVS